MEGKYHIHRGVALMAWPFNDIKLPPAEILCGEWGTCLVCSTPYLRAGAAHKTLLLRTAEQQLLLFGGRRISRCEEIKLFLRFPEKGKNSECFSDHLNHGNTRPHEIVGWLCPVIHERKWNQELFWWVGAKSTQIVSWFPLKTTLGRRSIVGAECSWQSIVYTESRSHEMHVCS